MAEIGIVISSIILLNYLLLSILVVAGIRRQREPSQINESNLPFVSILIAARNEERNLPPLFSSLEQLDYPVNLFEIIFIDDESTDRTRTIANAQKQKMQNLEVISPQVKYPNLNGKANALHNAMQIARGDIICITDADCILPQSWIRGFLNHYERDTAMVGGVTIITNESANGRLFYRLQSQDWLYILSTGSAAAEWGFPLSIIGNNMSFRRDDYFAVGGFEKAGFSVVEDYTLMRQFQECGKIIKLCADKKIIVSSAPARTLNSFLTQRKRWILGGRDISRKAKFIVILGFVGKILPAILLISGSHFTALISACLILLIDTTLIRYFSSRLDLNSLQNKAWVYPFFSICYSLLLIPMVLFHKTVVWKGRVYKL
ncbi:MAG: glycosyltransferase [Calditrichaeota bacterium]|nr:MAG: glycosyltransferase [Calditrichota bacterium]